MPQEPAPEVKKGRVLIVEDDEFLRDLIVKKLEEAGYEAAIAKDAEAALFATSTRIPDLILLDLILPSMNGLELMAKLHEGEATARIPFIVLSNSAETQMRQDSEAMGAAGYLVKAHQTPVDIVAAVEDFFSKHPPGQ